MLLGLSWGTILPCLYDNDNQPRTRAEADDHQPEPDQWAPLLWAVVAVYPVGEAVCLGSHLTPCAGHHCRSGPQRYSGEWGKKLAHRCTAQKKQRLSMNCSAMSPSRKRPRPEEAEAEQSQRGGRILRDGHAVASKQTSLSLEPLLSKDKVRWRVRVRGSDPQEVTGQVQASVRIWHTG